MALTLDEINHKLREAKPELLKRLELDVVLEAELERTDVITDALADTLKVPTQTPKQRTDHLIDSVRQGPVKRFLDLCKVLHEQGRPHILEYLDVDIKEIETQLASIAAEQNVVYFVGPSANKPEKLFHHQRRHYQEILSRVAIFKHIMRSSFVQIDKVFTKMETFDIDNDQDMQAPLHKRSQTKPISLAGMFARTGDSFLRILLEGNPGMGKSSILKHVAVKWATDNTHTMKSEVSPEGATSSDHPDYAASSPLVHADLLIFVDKSHEGKDLNSTIRNALNGSRTEQEKAFRFWQEHPQKCFLFLDGLDEFVNKQFLKDFYSFLSKGYMNILVSCRTGHPYLEKHMKSFNRHIKVSGFDQENAQAFVKRFLNSLNHDQVSGTDEKIQHLCSFLLKESVQSFYNNPMNCAFVCLLYYHDYVTREELSRLTLTDLFRKQQEWLLKRECVKRSDSQAEANDLEREAQTSVEGIYRLALHSLLEEGQTSYSEEDLKAFGIDLKSPAIVLLHEESDILGKSYSWPHQIIKEFHATSAVKNDTIRFMIASKPELNQLSKFLLSVLIDTDREAARDLLTAMLMMQSQDPPCATKPPKMSSASACRHPCTNIPFLKRFISEQNTEQLLHTPPAHVPLSKEFLRLTDIQQCLSNTTWALQNYPVIKRLIDLVMEVSSKDEHYELLRSVIHPYLPSSFSGSVHSWCRLCPWNAGDDWEDTTFWKLGMARSKFDYELHPVRGRCPLMVLQFKEAGGVAYLVCKLGQADSSKSTTYINILVHTVDDVIATAEHSTVLHRFAEKHQKPDVVLLWTRCDDWLWHGVPCGEDKADSGKWKEAIILLNDMFKPRKGVHTDPSYDELLTVEDQQELEQRKITFLDD